MSQVSRVSNGSPPPAHPDRLITLPDGIFAIAMTLLAPDVKVPPGPDTQQLHNTLRESPPSPPPTP
ncbi:TMEM175 family protein [Streptomyces cyaneofuscatus]|uniref:TMEM175 family protein n=1 Tax=Streptomyces cyaneofuscatus TaxID=66883 RepID=UPI0034149F2D